MRRLLSLLCLLAPLGFAERPATVNMQVEAHRAGALEAELKALLAQSGTPLWVGWSVPKAEGFGDACCYNDATRSCCSLEGERAVKSTQGGTVKLEGGRSAAVLLRLEQGRIEKTRVYGLDCQLDGGGRRLVWLEGVQPAASVAFLESRLRAGGETQDVDQLMVAIAAHGDPAADRALEAMLAPGQAFRLREKAAFWMGESRGRHGYEVLARLMKEERDERMRDKVVFALFVSKDPRAPDAILAAAKGDQSARVRGQALFWLAQKAGQKAAGAIGDAIRNDPETEVKKKAVFALSQLPKDEGVPLLINVARSNPNREVKKQAFFWLGQSKDPRALEFIAQVLAR